MNKIIKQESAISLFGIYARQFCVAADDATGRILNQKIKAKRTYSEDGKTYLITVCLRFDDEFRNGHETFSITANIRENGREYMVGCCHDEIERSFPELAHLIKWHLVSTDGPLRYLANTMYHADEHGPNRAWVYFKGQPDPLGLGGNKERLLAYCNESDARMAEGKPGYRVVWDEKTAKVANLEYARSSAVWPDATIEQLRDKSALMARLPALMSDFHLDMMRCGFVWPYAVETIAEGA